MAKKIRVLIVEDSALMRKFISDMINSDPGCEVVATASSGEEVAQNIDQIKPDVITLDLQLPKMDGIATLKHIMDNRPTPVIIFTGFSEFNGQEAIKCLEQGAVDLVMKPSGAISFNINNTKDELISKIKAASMANISVLTTPLFKEKPALKVKTQTGKNKLVIIASSAGGPKALSEIFFSLENSLSANVLVVQHMPSGFSGFMANRLNAMSSMHVKEAVDGGMLRPGVALIAPGGFNLEVEKSGFDFVVRLIKGPKIHNLRPSADFTMRSIAPLFSKNILAVVLTGMGSDGLQGVKLIKEQGGHILAQDKATSTVYGMPKAVYDAGLTDEVLPLTKIAQRINQWAKE